MSQSRNDPTRSLQRMERALLTPDELKTLPKGTFIVTKTGAHPIKVKLKLFFKWGIEFEKEPFVVPLRDLSNIKYACKDALCEAIMNKYHPKASKPDEDIPANATPVQEETMAERNMDHVEPRRPPKATKLEVTEPEGDST